MKPVTLLALLTAAAPLAAQVTETPDTIAPGKFFVRMDAISVGVNRDTSEPNKFTALGLATTIVSTGITRDVDAQVGLQFFARQTYQYKGTRTTHSGLGDVTLRSKWTYLRNEKIGAAAAVIPFIKLPTSTGGVGNDHVEGGVIFPWAMSLGGSTVVGAMAEWDLLRNDANNGYDSRWYSSAFVRQHLIGPWGAYAEATFGVSSATSSSFLGSLGGGVTWDFSKTLQLDYGLSRGLGNRATDWLHALRVRWEF
ncbi:MAG: transporter [Verrucomicrobia bacterium]|nr:transporter [Verrucomicrobiota bacterium]